MDVIRERQLQLCQRTLTAILAHLDGSGAPVTSSIGQMTADQWDPRERITEAVIHAEHMYTKVRDQV